MDQSLFPESTKLEETYRLVRMELEDVSAVCPIMLASEPWQSYGFSNDTVAGFLKGSVEAGLARVLVHFDDEASEETVVGVVVVQPAFLGGRYLEILAVAEKHRGRGLGRKIVDAVCREAPQNIRDLFVLVSVFNEDAVGFYDKLGFRDVGELSGLILPDRVERLIWLRFRDERG